MQRNTDDNNTFIKNEFLKQELKELFKNDPLFLELKNNNTMLFEDLFSQDFLSSLPTKNLLSTKEASKILNVSAGQVLYYSKPFASYIGYVNIGEKQAFYNFDHLSIFKLKMILLLKVSKKMTAIRALLNHSTDNNKFKPSFNHPKLEKLDENWSYDNVENILAELKKLKIENKILRAQIKSCNQEIEKLREENREQIKNIVSLINYLKE